MGGLLTPIVPRALGAGALREVIEMGSRLWVEGERPRVGDVARQVHPGFALGRTAGCPDLASVPSSLVGSGGSGRRSAFRNDRLDALPRRGAGRHRGERPGSDARAQGLVLDDEFASPLYHGGRRPVATPLGRRSQITPVGILRLDGFWSER